MHSALDALGVANRSSVLRQFKKSALSEGLLSDHDFADLAQRIETDPKRALRAIKTWSPPVGIDLTPCPPEWLRPGWRLATMFYWQEAIDELVSNLVQDAKSNTKPMRQCEVEEALHDIAHSARAILSRTAQKEIAELLRSEIAAEFLDPGEVVEHRKGGGVTIVFPSPKLRRSRAANYDGATSSPEYLPAEQTLYALFPMALMCALQDLQRLADRRADAADLKDVGGGKNAAHLLRPPLKRGLAIKCIAMIREAKGALPRHGQVLSLIESIWALAGLGPESFERPIREGLVLFRSRGDRSRNYADSLAVDLAISQHHFALRDPFSRSWRRTIAARNNSDATS